MGINVGIFFEESMGLLIFWIFLEPKELLMLRCFTPGPLNDPLLRIIMIYTPLWGSCLWPVVLLDRVMGWCSLLAIFTYLVLCRQQDGGGAVCYILKL